MFLFAKQQKVAQHVHRLSELMCRPPHLTGGHGWVKLRPLLENLRELTPAPEGSNVAPPAALAVAELQASRAKFLKRPLHFDPTPWLSFFSAATYIEPGLFLPLDGTPSIQQESCPPQQRGSEDEFMFLVRGWDKFGKLHLARPTEGPPSERRQLFLLSRDEPVDRIVHDSIEDFATRRKPPGWSVQCLLLGP